MKKKINVAATKSRDFGASLKNKLSRLVSTRKRRILLTMALVLMAVGALMAISSARYMILGQFIDRDVTILVSDVDSSKPVSGVNVSLGDFTSSSDAEGSVNFENVPVGQYTLKIEKKYYEERTKDFVVAVFGEQQKQEVAIKAVGREVVVSVLNRLSGDPIADAQIDINGATALTNAAGSGTLVLPTDESTQQGKITKDGFNDSSIEVVVGSENQELKAPLTPTGRLFFLSSRTGTINLMKSNLDGSGQEVALAGTGNEVGSETLLVSSRDWRYLALFSRRDSDKPKIHIFDTQDNSLTVADESDGNSELIGWSDHRFIYKVNRDKEMWEPKRAALMSFDAQTKRGVILDETNSSGHGYWDYLYESIVAPHIVADKVIYSKQWSMSEYNNPGDRKNVIVSVSSDGKDAKVLKRFDVSSESISTRVDQPNAVLFRIGAYGTDAKASFLKYINESLEPAEPVSDAKFYTDFAVSYLASPDSKRVFWYEQRDGKNVLLMSNADGEEKRELGTGTFVPYGWYGNDYVLLAKNGSELYIMPADESISETLPVKVTDYHKRATSNTGHTYGYGPQ